MSGICPLCGTEMWNHKGVTQKGPRWYYTALHLHLYHGFRKSSNANMPVCECRRHFDSIAEWSIHAQHCWPLLERLALARLTGGMSE